MDRLIIAADAVVIPGERHGEPQRDAVVVADGRIDTVGRLAELAAIDALERRFPGGFIVPGLRDAHFHAVSYAAAIGGVSLKTATDHADMIARLRAASAVMEPGRPLVAIRLDDETLTEGLPDRAVLDEGVPDRPLLVHRYCGHIAVANTAALDRAGVTAATADPIGGSLDRDDSGRPTGVLRETAIELVAGALARSLTVTPDQLVTALRGLAGLGLTSIGAMVGCGDGPWASLGDETEILAGAARDLPINVAAYIIASTRDQLLRVIDRLDGLSPRLHVRGVKRFADGSLGGHTAAMWQPFADRPDTTGLLRLTDADTRLAVDAAGMGLSVAVHAIGDRANAAVLDLYGAMIAAGTDPGLLRIEHASVLAPADIERFGSLGVTACIQPAFLGSETEWLAKRVGEARLPATYAFRSLAEAGVPLAGSSDCPVEPPHPLLGIALARDRAGINPAEALSAEEALALFTTGAAAALGEPAPLAPGSPADLVVLDTDPSASPGELRAARVLATFVAGGEVDIPAGWSAWND